MIVKFFGVRGSIPVCNADYQAFGGNTTCVQIRLQDTNTIAIFDAGTGIRDLGKEYLQNDHHQDEIFIAFSHFHWDHIQGFPFFGPAFIKNQKINILAMGEDRQQKNLKDIFRVQMREVYFPVQLDKMGANFNFMLLDKDMEIFRGAESGSKPTIVIANKHNHPGGAFGYRIERESKVFVFCTDIEHGDEIDQNVVRLAENADLLIHEAQYTTEELKNKKGWGHSSYEQAIQVAEMANVKQLAITHHDPDHDDDFLSKMEKECQHRYKDCFLAREQMEIEL
ncbi:MAG: MBL fold metallo-hydrolase [Ignavibacteriaceae bacterium]